ncbi:MAG TPA: hypothetical protein ENH99_02520 [Candidatus Pacearchaeota archaeon]|nr:hypothetical protein [Candidatus Pacearchaeota archaeon]
MKSLKPSMREKKRYLSVVGEVGDVEKAILDGIGVIGMSKTGLVWIKKGKNSGIISVNRETVNHVRASFALWPKKLEVVMVSGTLKILKGKEK